MVEGYGREKLLTLRHPGKSTSEDIASRDRPLLSNSSWAHFLIAPAAMNISGLIH